MGIFTALFSNLYSQATDPLIMIPSLAAGILGKSKKVALVLCLVIGGFFVTQSLFTPLPPHVVRLPWIAPFAFIVPVAVGWATYACKPWFRRVNGNAQRSLPARIMLSFITLWLGAAVCGGIAFGTGLLVITLADMHTNDGSAVYTVAFVLVPIAALVGAIAGVTYGWRRSRTALQVRPNVERLTNP